MVGPAGTGKTNNLQSCSAKAEWKEADATRMWRVEWAAIDQLAVVGKAVNTPVFTSEGVEWAASYR